MGSNLTCDSAAGARRVLIPCAASRRARPFAVIRAWLGGWQEAVTFILRRHLHGLTFRTSPEQLRDCLRLNADHNNRMHCVALPTIPTRWPKRELQGHLR